MIGKECQSELSKERRKNSCISAEVKAISNRLVFSNPWPYRQSEISSHKPLKVRMTNSRKGLFGKMLKTKTVT